MGSSSVLKKKKKKLFWIYFKKFQSCDVAEVVIE
jgi:hypothetical protein